MFRGVLIFSLWCGVFQSALALSNCLQAFSSKTPQSTPAKTRRTEDDLVNDRERTRLQAEKHSLQLAAQKAFREHSKILRVAAEFIKKHDYKNAFAVLENDTALISAEIYLEPKGTRESTILTEAYFNGSPQYAVHKLHQSSINGALARGFDDEIPFAIIRIHQLKIRTSSGTFSIWNDRFDQIPSYEAARGFYVDAFFEEHAHALQQLKILSGDSPYLTLEGELLESVLMWSSAYNRVYYNSNGKDAVELDLEADVYAFMLQELGSENVPKEFSESTNYPTRNLVRPE